MPFAIIGASASTLSGWMATIRIRDSGGKLGGMELALFVALLFPILLLDGLIMFVWMVGAKFLAVSCFHLGGAMFFNIPHFVAWVTLMVISVCWVDSYLLRWVWTTVIPLDAKHASVSRWQGMFLLVLCLATLMMMPMIMFSGESRVASARDEAIKPTTALSANPVIERVVVNPPFVARLSEGTVELLGLAPEDSTNALCWYPNGTMSSERFPEQGGGFGKSAEDVKIAFRVDLKHSVTDLSINFIHQPQSRFGWEPIHRLNLRSPVAIFCDHVLLPSGTSKLNVEVGVADGPWEEAVTLNGGVPGIEGASTSETARDGTKWSAAVEMEPSKQEREMMTHGGANASGSIKPQASQSNRNDVVVAVQYTVNKEWETRLVGLGAEGGIPLSDGKNMYLEGTDLKSTFFSIPPDELARISGYQLQRREYQWVEFRNVSLQAGHATTVEIRDIRRDMESKPAAQKLPSAR